VRTSHLLTVRRTRGFTLVELLVVIVVIAILASISVVAYNGIQTRARNTVLQSDLRNAATQLELSNATDGSYPSGSSVPSNLIVSADNEFQYISDGSTYCLTITSATSGMGTYHISSGSGAIQEGACAGHVASGSGGSSTLVMQTVTTANCPSTRTLAVDARDNRTYWIQLLADGKCWMETNLAYAGGGTDMYSDVRTLTNGTGIASTYTTPSYYVVPSTTNYTTDPSTPSLSTDGMGQYGYLYNWCGAMGGQATAACSTASTPAINPSLTICPYGWRLPTGNGGQVGALNTSINSGSYGDDAGLRTAWLGQYGGYWYNNSFSQQGNQGAYWTWTLQGNTTAYYFYVDSSYVDPWMFDGKNVGYAVRCVTN